MSTVSSSKLPWSPSSRVFLFFFGAGYFAQLDQAENCKQCFYSTFFLSPLHKIKCVI